MKLNKRKRNAVASLFRRAAAKLARMKSPTVTDGACAALAHATRGSILAYSRADDAMYFMFREDAREKGPGRAYWGMNFGAYRDWRARRKQFNSEPYCVDVMVARDGRVLMLCFLAAMAEAGDL